MAQTASYKVVTGLGVFPLKYSSGHAAVGREILISVTPGSSASSSGMVLSLANDVKGTIQDFTIGEFTGVASTKRWVRYSSAAGSASTGKLYFFSTTISAGDTASNTVLSKAGENLSGFKFRARVLHS